MPVIVQASQFSELFGKVPSSTKPGPSSGRMRKSDKFRITVHSRNRSQSVTFIKKMILVRGGAL